MLKKEGGATHFQCSGTIRRSMVFQAHRVEMKSSVVLFAPPTAYFRPFVIFRMSVDRRLITLHP